MSKSRPAAMAHVRVEAQHQVSVGMMLDRLDGGFAAHDGDHRTIDLAAIGDGVKGEGNNEADAVVRTDLGLIPPCKGALEHEEPVAERQDGARQREFPRTERRAGAETEHLVGAKFVEIREALDAEDARWF
ncbi:hypothetical protein AB7M69_005218 [Bradyrhizobium japonicum]